ncbi:MAG: type II toxin-antitoxin system RelE/ParE family toxin [Magnetococcales bacterium]|nr:type II toxin-antitoxin system RelE/ParE family toxin [Magnetococcales bacterium]MBF0115309.1 type II toxin-antitoxin system RelE/ParE family toxin [Magnetococcales bacterium]
MEAIDHIRQDNSIVAREYSSRAKKALRRLEPFPNSGRRLPEFPDSLYREVIIPPYRFIYRAIGTAVWIVTVWHDARILENLPEM